MSSYVVLARRWRPRSFASLVGQQHVVRALRNALATGRIPHAFLFSGTRGVGKTTLARILAMRLNCREAKDAEPCGVCDSCQEVIAGSHPDVLEIDAASRTKVEQMRELLELAPYAPASSPYKVFILDEVHMLSTQSFNALLKTLEEPPAHVKFIFATTEPRKIPATILSRCQRHDLKRVTPALLIDHLENILRQEGIDWDADALEAVARAADGSVRDGLSLLDQVIAHGQGEVRFEAVRALLGLTDLEAVERLLDRVMGGYGPEVLESLAHFHVGGVEPVALMRDLLDLVHRRTRERVVGGAASGEGPGLEQLQMVYQTFLKGEGEIKLADHPAQALEMVVLRATYLRPIPELDKLIAMLAGGGPVAPPAPVVPPASAPPPVPAVAASATLTPLSAPVVAAPPDTRSLRLSEAGGTRPPEPSGQALSLAEKMFSSPVKNGPTHDSVSKKSTETPASRPEGADAGVSEALTSWDQLLSSATENAPEVARKMRGQVACIAFGVPEEGGEVCLRLRLVDACFGTPERMREILRLFLRERGLAGIQVVVEPPSSEPRPETVQERIEREEREYRRSLEEKLLERPDARRLMETFSARLISVEPLRGASGPNLTGRRENRL
ncbi:MAG: DNA polymerase III subunit gamma/tau [Magnetococcales bacterium]|nr:DNA polymerase III subunit gamma/tau [Magnetococcales bacterium]